MSNLFKLLFCFSFLLLFTSTDYKNYYYLLNEDKYAKLSNKGDKEILKRSIVFRSINKPSKSPHLEEDETTKTSFFVYLVKKRKYNQVNEFLELHNSELNIHHFYKGLNYFMNASYSKARQELLKYDQHNFEYYKLLLLSDCEYELKGFSSKDDIIKSYQNAFDASQTGLQKKIVKDRIKYIIYKK